VSAATASADVALADIKHYFEHLSRDSLSSLERFYAPEVRFKDPFNEVQGTAEVRRIFTHMFDNLHEPRFVVHEVVAQGTQAFLVWDFLFRMKRLSTAEQCIRGSSHLRLDGDGRITWHRDYWDAAEELYEKLPLVGGLMRWLKKRAAS
jgi:steroid Delta-isomerase